MEDDLGASEDERAIELSSIEAIYPEIKIDPAHPFVATLDIPVIPEKPLKIYFQASADGGPPSLPTPPNSNSQGATLEKRNVEIGTAAALVDTHELSYLPPISVKITLPAEYPISQPPIVELSSIPRWIPRSVLKTLKEDCSRLWEEIGRDQVVYIYIDHIQQAAETGFDIASNTEQRFSLSSDLKLALLDYDLKERKSQFERGTFDCGICLEPKKGVSCHRLLLCGHVFCVACLQDFYNNCINEGDVDNVKCLSPDCGKADIAPGGKKRRHDRTLNPSELLQIPLEQETVQRYVRLKRKKKLESDKNTVYCPRQWCQGAARSKKHPKPTNPFNDFEESESEPEDMPPKKQKKNDEDTPMSDRLCVCEDCNFAFCSVCKKGWHGELARCNPRRQAELNEEEKASLAYMEKFSTPCPTCNARSQKTYGCNHMICFKCKTHFCYLCSAYLMPDNPYRHFNDFKSTCYMRLWELEGGDGADAGMGFAGGAGNAVPWEPEDFDSDSDADSEMSDEDFGDFDGDDLIMIRRDDEEDDDTDDEPPPPNPRQANQNMRIEIVNFARDGAHHRIELLPQPGAGGRGAAPPPVVPNPPRRRGRGQEGNRQRRMQQEPQRRVAVAAAAPAAPNPPRNGRPAIIDPEAAGEFEERERRDLPRAAPGQGNNAAADNLPAPARAMGLERFLELALNDQEDEWDSDELEDEAEAEEEHREPNPRPRRAPLRR